MAIALTCGGMPRRSAPQMNIGNVVALVPVLKFVMMKSSKHSENASSAAATMPGSTSGRMTRRNVCHAWRRGPSPPPAAAGRARPAAPSR